MYDDFNVGFEFVNIVGEGMDITTGLLGIVIRWVMVSKREGGFRICDPKVLK